jgi:hypothetical protein
MAENTKRGLFRLNGITGMLIATVLLLSILAVLTVWSILVQQASASNYYNPAPIAGSLDNVKMNSTANKDYAFQDAK